MLADSFIVDPSKARCDRLRRTVTEWAKQLNWEADMIAQKMGQRAYRKTFVTLTYRKVGDWKPGHITEFIKSVRQWMRRRGSVCRFVWVGELQKRGALHYHVLLWVPRKLRLPCPDHCGWWSHGMSNIETARNPVGYMVKYATKTRPQDLRRLPKGVRLHGNGGACAFSRGLIRMTLWPRWLRERNNRDCFMQLNSQDEVEALGVSLGWTVVRRCNGGRVNVDTGEFFETPWRVQVKQGVVSCMRREAA